MLNFKTATVVNHSNPSTTFHVVKLQVDEQEFSFEAGQHISIKVAEKKLNNYSIASMPDGSELVLIIDVTPGREGSKLIENLQVGDVVEFLGPMGIFKLQMRDGAEELVFMATGSGISPIKSMIEQLLLNLDDKRKISLYFGLRHCEDIFLHDFFEELMEHHENFKFVPCLSKPDETWKGQCGHITDLVKQDFKDGSKLAVYSCGNKGMITEGHDYFKSIGTPEERIYHETFY